jgi:hypothetical protein
MRITIRCPECEARAIARSSRELSKTMREITYTCTDPECGHSYVCTLEAVRALTPSCKSKNNVRLPLSEHARNSLMKQLDLLPTS